MTTTSAVTRVMDKAQAVDREALFAGLQAAVVRLVATGEVRSLQHVEADLAEIERRLEYGHPYGHAV